jgi:hypothetical protein
MTIKGKNETTMEHVKLIYYDPHKILELYNKERFTYGDESYCILRTLQYIRRIYRKL